MNYVFIFWSRAASNQKLKENFRLTFPAEITPYIPGVREVVNYPLAGRCAFRGRVLDREITFQTNDKGEPQGILITFDMQSL